MPTKNQLSKMRESEFEYPQTRRSDDPMFNSSEINKKEKMELFIDIKFNLSEFDKIEKVLYFLTNEGWSISETKEFSIKRNNTKEIVSKSYKLRRLI